MNGRCLSTFELFYFQLRIHLFQLFSTIQRLLESHFINKLLWTCFKTQFLSIGPIFIYAGPNFHRKAPFAPIARLYFHLNETGADPRASLSILPLFKNKYPLPKIQTIPTISAFQVQSPNRWCINVVFVPIVVYDISEPEGVTTLFLTLTYRVSICEDLSK